MRELRCKFNDCSEGERNWCQNNSTILVSQKTSSNIEWFLGSFFTFYDEERQFDSFEDSFNAFRLAESALRENTKQNRAVLWVMKIAMRRLHVLTTILILTSNNLINAILDQSEESICRRISFFWGEDRSTPYVVGFKEGRYIHYTYQFIYGYCTRTLNEIPFKRSIVQ